MQKNINQILDTNLYHVAVAQITYTFFQFIIWDKIALVIELFIKREVSA